MSDLEIKQLQDHVKGLSAQLDACKQMFNETSNANLNMRSHIIVLNQHIQEQDGKLKSLADANQNLIKEVMELKSKLEPVAIPE
jgi:chromosome segregation ATPase